VEEDIESLRNQVDELGKALMFAAEGMSELMDYACPLEKGILDVCQFTRKGEGGCDGVGLQVCWKKHFLNLAKKGEGHGVGSSEN